MDNRDPESGFGSELHFENFVRAGANPMRMIGEIGPAAPVDSSILIGSENGARRDALYRAVMALSRSIAGCTDLRSFWRAQPDLFAELSASIMLG